MKKIIVIAVLLTAIVLMLGFLVLNPSRTNGRVPRYTAAKSGTVAGDYNYTYPAFLNLMPFAGGKMWIANFSPTNRHLYLFDIEKRTVLGELTNAHPEIFNPDQTEVLCTTRENIPSKTKTWKPSLAQVLRAMHWLFYGGRNHFGDEEQAVWLVNLQNGSAKKLGILYQLSGSGSTFKESPDSRHAYNKPTASFNLSELYICDLEKKTLRRETVDGSPSGWWDNGHILIKNSKRDLMLFDIQTRVVSPLVGFSTLMDFCAANGLTNNPATINPFVMWNGHEYEFYLSAGNDRWSAVESFLVKIERPGGNLKLLDPHFKYEWSDHFDPSASFYLYSGRDSGKTNSAVYLRDLKKQQTRVLVPPGSTNDAFSIPQFYGSNVIYVHSNAIWQIGMDGNNNHRIFPPD